MFGRSKPAVFKPVPYTRQRQPKRVPRWLVILLVGIGLGAGGLYYIQTNHMPPTMSASESARVLEQLDKTGRERDQLQKDLTQRTSELETARNEATKANEELAGAKKTIDRMQKDLVLFVDALPPDPRGNTLGIRAADIAAAGGKLNYHVVVTRAVKGGAPFQGVVQLLALGQKSGGREETVSVASLPVAIGAYQHVQGSAALPEGFAAREVTVKVLDGPNGKLVSMRVFRI